MKKDNKKISEALDRGEVLIYQDKDKDVSVEAVLEDDTVWLSQKRMGILFGVDTRTINEHLKNIYKSNELKKESTIRKSRIVQREGDREVMRNIEFFNLDAIISVGYRVNSKRATQFRIWATKTLKEYIVKGYTLNSRRLEELRGKQLNEFEQAVGLIRKTIDTKLLSGGEESGLLKVITEYANSWLLLQRYDEDRLTLPKKVKKPTFSLKYDFARLAISDLKKDLIKKGSASELFGNERSSLEGIIGNIYQTFGGSELYSSIEEKAAHLLYFVIKDHPFADGNKRIGSFLFIVFLAQNKHLFRKNGDKKINDNALVAVALLVAESEPSHKDTLIKLITNLIND